MLSHKTVLHPPIYSIRRHNGTALLIDPETPHWMTTSPEGADLLSLFDGQKTFGNVLLEYMQRTGYEGPKAWQDVDTLARDALRCGFLSEEPRPSEVYPGRADFLSDRRLSELWIHINNACNLSCSHCLVSSGPDQDRGLPTDVLIGLMHDARKMGTRRFFFTGGEPFLRKDIALLIQTVFLDPQAELAILTNGLLLTPARLAALQPYPRLHLQISLDGSTPAINDPIRGGGSYARIVCGIKDAVAAGLHVTVSTVITAANVSDIAEITRQMGSLGVRTHHLLWLHQRGRADASHSEAADCTPEISDLIEAVRAARQAGQERGVIVDNHEAIKARLRYPAGTKRDLAGAGLVTLCVYADGEVYPSAAFANIPDLRCGNILKTSLSEIFQHSRVIQKMLSLSVAKKPICSSCDLKFLCGGGDMEHAYFYGGALDAHDPYCDLHQAMFLDAFFELSQAREALRAPQSGFQAPIVTTSMGEQSVHCADAEALRPVITSRSECVLTFDLDAPRKVVREFYGAVAVTPSASLCCPTPPRASDMAHIPSEVIERFYGCGSPIDLAGIVPGETVLDLGSGAGIDVFIAAKKTGPTGRAIGVDMTPQMLEVARAAQSVVAARLGYDIVTFKEGFLEELPMPDRSVQLVTSNCVINLSSDKQRVFSEMWRVLDQHGRMVVSDIVADKNVPPHQRQNPRLWGECISGALTEEAFLLGLERAGFYGLQILHKAFWKEIEGCCFSSLTVRGYKFEKTEGCVYLGQTATYLGPGKGMSDEEGHGFPRNVPVPICTDTAAKLSHPPYRGFFIISGDGFTAMPCDTPSGCC